MVYHKLRPSKTIWNYWKGEITPLLIVTSIADVMADYHISYSATELLKDLGLLTKSGRPNKEARLIVGHYLHEKYHRNANAIEIINPLSGHEAIQATLEHDAGAYGRCSFCGRYSINPLILQEDHCKPCDCGKTHGYSGSFEPPTKDSIWNSN